MPSSGNEKHDTFDTVLTSANVDVVVGNIRPAFEDFVYFAAAQREVDRFQDGVV